MCRPYPLAVISLAVILGSLHVPSAAHAESLSCTSVNGVTRCVGSGGLDCRTVDDRMVCLPGSKGHCETIAGVTTCTNGDVTQRLHTMPRPASEPDENAQKPL